MEFNVTKLTNMALDFELDSMQYSASMFELGQDAGRITWDNCLELAESLEGPDRLAVMPSSLEEIRNHFREYGAWEEDEILAWSDLELNALLIQELMSSVREVENFETRSEWEKACTSGECSGRLYSDSNNNWYLYIGV